MQRLLAVAAVMAVAVSCAGLAEAREVSDGGIEELEARVEAQELVIRRTMEEIRAAGVRLEENQARVDMVRARAEELRVQVGELRSQLLYQRRSLAEERARYRERARAAYRGRDLGGIALLLERMLRDSGNFGGAADVRVLRMLLEGREVLQEHKERQIMLRGTLRQISQKRKAYREVLRRETVLIRELEAQRRDLRRAVQRIGVERKQALERLRELRSIERRVESSAEVGPIPEDAWIEQKREQVIPDAPTDIERELEIARREIVVRPVESLHEEEYMVLYRRAAQQYGFGTDWYVLAAVGKIESNHGKEMGPSVSGAMGPMQFLPSTWQVAGVDGNGDGVANIMDPEDAIPAAASYLVSGGAPEDWHAALYSYNRAHWYVLEVLAVAEGYRRLAGDDGAGPYL